MNESRYRRGIRMARAERDKKRGEERNAYYRYDAAARDWHAGYHVPGPTSDAQWENARVADLYEKHWREAKNAYRAARHDYRRALWGLL